jgi:hypothetical protein
MIRETNELFLMGLLSVMDALLNVPMTEVLNEIPADEEIKKALLGVPADTARFSKLYWTTCSPITLKECANCSQVPDSRTSCQSCISNQ